MFYTYKLCDIYFKYCILITTLIRTIIVSLISIKALTNLNIDYRLYSLQYTYYILPKLGLLKLIYCNTLLLDSSLFFYF